MSASSKSGGARMEGNPVYGLTIIIETEGDYAYIQPSPVLAPGEHVYE